DAPGVNPLGAGDGIRNLEGHDDFDVVWPWRRPTPLRRGATVVLRVKNEAVNLAYVLPPLLRAVDAVLVVDNNSTDGTADEAVRVAELHGAADKLTVAHYPFDVARPRSEEPRVAEER